MWCLQKVCLANRLKASIGQNTEHIDGLIDWNQEWTQKETDIDPTTRVMQMEAFQTNWIKNVKEHTNIIIPWA